MTKDVRPSVEELEHLLQQNPDPMIEITPAGEVVPKGLSERIRHALNCVCAENESNTPDFILADYLVSCLAAFDRAVNQRERWYGRSPRHGVIAGACAAINQADASAPTSTGDGT
jgi:hypothetical protein